ncbi:MAG: FAD-dependent oxidoreductase [Limisphaerales bacterium]
MTIVIVGGGPTGVELAGAFAELARTVLAGDFRHIDPTQARIILIEGSPRVLAHLPPDLSASAQRQLEKLGVQVRTALHVKAIRAGEVELVTGEIIRAGTILWAAGVSATPLTQQLGVELDKAGRVKVNPDLSLPQHPEIFAIGDMALVLEADGKPVPGVSPAAMQMGKHVAKIIEDEIHFGVGRGAASVIQVLGQRHDGDHRALFGSGVDRQNPAARIRRVAFMAVRPPRFSHRLSQSHHRVVPMDLCLFHLQTRRAHHHPPDGGNRRRKVRLKIFQHFSCVILFCY